MSDTKPSARGLTRTEIAEHLAAREAEAKPSAGAELVARWRDAHGERLPFISRRQEMAADIDAAISLHAQHAWTTGAGQMRDECASALRRCSRPAEADIVADVPLPLPPRATPLVADAGAQPTDAAIEQARHEGAEAMREACRSACNRVQDGLAPLRDAAMRRGAMSEAANTLFRAYGAQDCVDAIDTLPLPGDAS